MLMDESHAGKIKNVFDLDKAFFDIHHRLRSQTHQEKNIFL